MRVVLDEALPAKLATMLQDAGLPTERFPANWKGMKDGALLQALESGDGAVLLTCDRSMPFQQTLARRRVAVIVLPGQRLSILAPLVPAIAEAVFHARTGTVITLDRTGLVVPSGS